MTGKGLGLGRAGKGVGSRSDRERGGIGPGC